jgi:hypothetical protein
MQLDPSLEAALEELRTTIASGDWMGQKYIMRGSMFASILWTVLCFKELFADKMSWQRFQRVYRDHSHLFMNWIHGRTSFTNSLGEFLEACGAA